MSKESLKSEIAKKQAELAALVAAESEKDKSEAIKDLSEYTTDEKVAKFDSLYKSALSMLESKGSEDDAHYTWEDVMSLLSKDHKKFWKYYNSL